MSEIPSVCPSAALEVSAAAASSGADVPQPPPSTVTSPMSPPPVRHPPELPPEMPSEVPPPIQDPPVPGADAPIGDPQAPDTARARASLHGGRRPSVGAPARH